MFLIKQISFSVYLPMFFSLSCSFIPGTKESKFFVFPDWSTPRAAVHKQSLTLDWKKQTVGNNRTVQTDTTIH